MKDVRQTTKDNLCISCGICKAVCPVDCITYKPECGMQLPVIDLERCVKCGKCYRVCPGKGIDYTEKKDMLNDDDFWFGNYHDIVTAHVKRADRRHNAVSGGVVTQLIDCLLQSGAYESAFLIDCHEYDTQKVQTAHYKKGDDLKDTQKSRYLPVSHERAVSYIIKHKDEKIILVGTGCFIEGFWNVMEEYRLNRDNYFLIGLFCDKTMSYHVIKFFENHKALQGETMNKLYFRSKEAGGWPGDVLLETQSGKKVVLPKTERMKVKDYFVPERCLYCLDKLNMFADISVGDNYTGEFSDSEGSNSVIIRTARGKEVWEQFKEEFEYRQSSKDAVVKSQHLNGRKANLQNDAFKSQQIKHSVNHVDIAVKKTAKGRIRYGIKRFKSKVGMRYGQKPYLLSVCLIWKNMKLKIKQFI